MIEEIPSGKEKIISVMLFFAWALVGGIIIGSVTYYLDPPPAEQSILQTLPAPTPPQANTPQQPPEPVSQATPPRQEPASSQSPAPQPSMIQQPTPQPSLNPVQTPSPQMQQPSPTPMPAPSTQPQPSPTPQQQPSPLPSPIPSPTPPPQGITSQQVANHNSINDCWLIISNKVYDVTNFIYIHPGDPETIIPYCGKEATEPFKTKDKPTPKDHKPSSYTLLESYYVGNLA